jgi:hypothetical protein
LTDVRRLIGYSSLDADDRRLWIVGMWSVKMTSLVWGGWARLAMTVSGLLIFASATFFLHAFITLGCALGWDGRTISGFNLLTVVLMVVWLAHLIPIATLAPQHFNAARAGRGGAHATLLLWLTFIATSIGLVATLRVGFPLMVLPACL